MGTAKDHPSVKYFAAIAFTPGINIEAVFKAVEKIFSPIAHESEAYDYTRYTTYYNREMGEQITKRFIVFHRLSPAESLPDFKIATNKLENDYRIDNRRQVNIDPGYLSEANLILATTKNYSHRIYLHSGIYADLHLIYSKKRFQVMPWTYPDYQSPQILQFFTDVRSQYLQQLNTIT